MADLQMTHLAGRHPYSCVVSCDPMGEDVCNCTCTSGGRILPGEVIWEPFPSSWSAEYVNPHSASLSFGAPFVESVDKLDNLGSS